MRIRYEDFLVKYESIQYSEEVWKSLVSKNNITRNDLIIMISENRNEANRFAIQNAFSIKQKYNVRKIFFVGYVTVALNSDVDEFVYISDNEYRAICDLYRIYKFSDKIIFCNTDDVTDKSIFCLENFKNIKRQEIISLGIFGLGNLDTKQREVENNRTTIFSKGNLLQEPSIEDKISELIENKKICANDNVVVFGANNYVERIIRKFSEFGTEIYAIIDNNTEKAHTVWSGLTVYLPDELLNKKEMNFKVIIASGYYLEMGTQMEKMGYEKDKNYFIIETRRNCYDYKLNLLDKQRDYIKNGYQKYIELEMQFGDVYIFLNKRATGNTYLLGLYLEDYVKRNEISNYMVFNVSAAGHRICNLLGIPSQLISKHDAISLMKFCGFIGEKKVNFRELCPYDYKTNLLEMRIYKGLNFNYIYKYVLYENFNTDFSLDKYKTCASKKENTGKVLISPYANTVSNIDIKFWSRLINCLKDKGYEVYTNCAPNEEEISDTIKVYIPYEHLFEQTMDYDIFIGVRSGLCDLLSATDIRMVVLYPSNGGKLEDLFDYNYYSLEKMGLRKNNLIEIDISEDNMGMNTKKILQWIEKCFN